MRRWRPAALPVFWQTLLLLIAAVLVSQAIGIALLFWLPAPRPDFNRLSDIGAVLVGERVLEARDDDDGERALHVHVQPAPPSAPAGLIADAGLTRALAARLFVPAERVRLYFEPERRSPSPFGRHGARAGTWHRHEPIFFGRVSAALASAQGWRVAETPPPPLVAPWQRRMMLWFAVSALALAPLAWVFARRISRPIRRFADAADRLRADPHAPAVPEEGPAELRVTARALNRMQDRLATYLQERTAMIGAIAHDLRTPLARIAFRVEGAPDAVRDKVLGDVEQMRAMLAATIGFVRHTGDTEERVAVDLAALLVAIVEQDRDLGRAVKFAPGPAAMVQGDPLALERLFQNLIDNGLTYGKEVAVALAIFGGQAIITIADRGPGLPPERIEQLFRPFERGEPSRNRDTGGIGLGLTIARAIAEAHGGSVALVNRDGGGVEARVSLPMAD